MAFATGLLTDPVNTNPGVRLQPEADWVRGYTTFENGLKVGRFAKLDTGSIDNMDGSASPVLAGIVLRNVTNDVESAATVDNTLETIANLVQFGPATLELKSGVSPTTFGRVYVSNAGDANDGLGTVTTSDVATNCVYLYEIKTGVWAVWVNMFDNNVLSAVATISALATENGDLIDAAAAVTPVSAADADGTYDADTATLINANKVAINAILTALTR